MGHSSYTLMIAVTSVWIWIFFEGSKDEFYAGAQTLKWYMYAVNWIPVCFLLWDVWAEQNSGSSKFWGWWQSSYFNWSSWSNNNYSSSGSGMSSK